MRKHILGGIALAALLASTAAHAQVTGACPANQFVSVVGNNIPAAACSQPTVANLSGTLPATSGGTGVANAAGSTLTLGGALSTTGSAAEVLAFPAGANTYTFQNRSSTLMTGALSATTGLAATQLSMTDMRTAAGLMMTASASSTNYGLTYTPGTTAILIGTATSSSSTSNVAALDFRLPPTYIAGTDVTVKVGCYYTDASSTASVHTMTAAAYLNGLDGLQGTTLIATSAQVCPITTSAQQTFTITGTTLVPGSLLTLTFTLNMTNGAGASTGRLTSVALN